MKIRKYRSSERGVALVLTLIMLGVVTVMAIIFLAITRRERSSVKLTEDQAMARAMAEAALERAKVQAMAGLAGAGSKNAYDLFNSTSYVNYAGFDRSKTNGDPYNVGWTATDGKALTQTEHLKMLGNLQFDPRAPVFISTNEANPDEKDFRFFVDFNRNRQYERSGFLADVDTNGVFWFVNGRLVTNRYVGDPEWIGVLEHPDRPHGENNRIIGRYAFLALPVGKMLDLNFMHNQANTNSADDISRAQANNGFNRNQGIGSFELNLAAFFRELNGHNYAWPANTYRHSAQLWAGEAFYNARGILNIRYDGKRSNLLTAEQMTNNFRIDGYDTYVDDLVNLGAKTTNPAALFSTFADNDLNTLPWAGSSNIFSFTDVQELFTLGGHSGMMTDFTNRLHQPGKSDKKGTYDRYTVYRMLAQLGVDSTPAIKGKMHLNYENPVGQIQNLTNTWTNALSFFTNAADLMLKASIERRIYPVKVGVQETNLFTNYFIGDTLVRPDISITNIQLWRDPRLPVPLDVSDAATNEYTATVHRILQVAVNIFDAMTNRFATNGIDYPFLPTVIKPVFTKTATNLYISGFMEVHNARVVADDTWTDLMAFATNANPGFGLYTNRIIYGQPFIIGAKKGHPNFNEMSLESFAMMSRRLQLGKDPVSRRVTQTNQLLTFTLNSFWGLEGWNSYRVDYPRRQNVFAEVHSSLYVTNFYNNTNALMGGTNLVMTTSNSPGQLFITITNWPGTTNVQRQFENYRVVLTNQVVLMRDLNFSRNPLPQGSLRTNVVFESVDYDQPHFVVYSTNRVRYWAVDPVSQRLIDFVNMDKLVSVLDVGEQLKAGLGKGVPLIGGSAAAVQVNEAAFWLTNRPNNALLGLTEGMSNQIAASLGELTFPTNNSPDPNQVDRQYNEFWRDYNRNSGLDRQYSIDSFRQFVGLAPLYSTSAKAPPGLTYEAPFTPTRRFYNVSSWQVNDPLVHYNERDLWYRHQSISIPKVTQPLGAISAAYSSLGKINPVYRPWGIPGPPVANQPNQPNHAYNWRIKDPGIKSSDDWVFPVDLGISNSIRFPSIGWLGRVHRGTPWQTIYLKAGLSDNATWTNFVGANVGTMPYYDRRLLEVFTAAAGENAARGLLSVNQTNQAAWSAVLSGIPIIRFSHTNLTMRTPNPEYYQDMIEPGDGGVSNIVASINAFRAGFNTKVHWYKPNANANPSNIVYRTGFNHLGDVLGAPAFSDQSPYLFISGDGKPVAIDSQVFREGVRDEMMEKIPQSILGLLAKDEPRFVVYSFGQSLKPAQGSMATSADFYGMITNYAISGEVITKTTFRIDGEVDDPAKPLRAVVENHTILPPPE